MKKVFWDITYQCNAKCKYCFTNSGVNPERDRLALTISEQKQLIDIPYIGIIIPRHIKKKHIIL